LKNLFSLETLKSKSGAADRFCLATLVFCFFLPIITRGIIIPLVLFLVAWLYLPNKSLQQKWKPVLIFSSIYLAHLMAMLYTENLPRGISDIEQKLSLILFPFVVGSTPKSAFPARKDMFMVFVLGLMVSIIICFGESIYNYLDSGLITEFYMSAFSITHHPSYLAMYINLGIAAFLIYLLPSVKSESNPLSAFLVFALLIAGLVYSASKMGYIQFVVLMLFALIYFIFQRSLNAKMVLLLFGLAGGFLLLLFVNPVASNRIVNTVEVVSNESTDMKPSEEESTVARITTWKLTLDEIRKHPFGVGTGDIQDVLDVRYKQEGYFLLAEKGLNPHNNFLQIALAQGIPALLIFLFSLVFPFGKIWKEKDWMYAFFLIGIVMHIMVESMLEKQSGVMFFAFFNAYFYFSSDE